MGNSVLEHHSASNVLEHHFQAKPIAHQVFSCFSTMACNDPQRIKSINEIIQRTGRMRDFEILFGGERKAREFLANRTPITPKISRKLLMLGIPSPLAINTQQLHSPGQALAPQTAPPPERSSRPAHAYRPSHPDAGTSGASDCSTAAEPARAG